MQFNIPVNFNYSEPQFVPLGGEGIDKNKWLLLDIRLPQVYNICVLQRHQKLNGLTGISGEGK